MNKVFSITAAVLSCWGASAAAEGLSFEATATIGSISNEDGGNEILSNSGIDDQYTRQTDGLNLSVAYGFGDGLTAVGMLDYGTISSPNDDEEDATQSTRDLTLRLLADRAGVTFGGFIGAGNHGDYGDSYEPMTYSFAGAEISGDTSYGGYYAQVGYLDSTDEYDEGTQDAPFVNVGAYYDVSAYTFSGSFGYAGGTKYGSLDTNRILNANLGVARDFGDYELFANYDLLEISYEDPGNDRLGDTFGTFSLGVNFALGGAANHGSPLPSLGNWVAFNANEIE